LNESNNETNKIQKNETNLKIKINNEVIILKFNNNDTLLTVYNYLKNNNLIDNNKIYSVIVNFPKNEYFFDDFNKTTLINANLVPNGILTLKFID
jgi:hypothetical protein